LLQTERNQSVLAGNHQLVYTVPPPQPVVFVPAPLPTHSDFQVEKTPLPDTGYSSDTASSSSSRSTSLSTVCSHTASSSAGFSHKHRGYRWERDMDLDAMTRRNGGTIMHAEYVDKMNYLCKINNQNGFEFDRALLNLNAIRNRFLDEDILELHGLQRKLATDVLKKTVCEVQNGLRPKKLFLCVGQGVVEFTVGRVCDQEGRHRQGSSIRVLLSSDERQPRSSRR
ncbi:hypothetical protein PRIPAC_92572, partial [Pristionchus pacificus]|uniref:Uncharacterized protein n=1 Tax=Pristionchus pacificus TaxID=54126 RepID=A0A2A6BAA0_PRIPA